MDDEQIGLSFGEIDIVPQERFSRQQIEYILSQSKHVMDRSFLRFLSAKLLPTILEMFMEKCYKYFQCYNDNNGDADNSSSSNHNPKRHLMVIKLSEVEEIWGISDNTQIADLCLADIVYSMLQQFYLSSLEKK